MRSATKFDVYTGHAGARRSKAFRALSAATCYLKCRRERAHAGGGDEPADWRWVVGTNLDAAFHVAREAFKLMTTHGGGRIVNNGSVSAAAPRPGSVAYTASKHAVTGLTKSLALDGRPFDIAAGQIDFGNVVSAISDGMATGMPQADGSVRPEARMEASDAADAVFYMASLPCRRTCYR